MAKLTSPGVFATIIDSNMSYFEEMCWRAEHGSDPLEREQAQLEVDWMVEANNKAEEEDRMATLSNFGGLIPQIEPRSKVAELTEHINEEVRNMCDSIHYESNDAITRGKMKEWCEELMQGLAFERHISDFVVVCDERNNTPSRIDRGELWVDIQFKLPNGTIYLAGGNTILSKATAPVGQITMDDDEDVLSIINSTSGSVVIGNGMGTVNLSSGSNVSTGILAGGANGYAVNSIGAMVGHLTLDLTVSQEADLPGVTFHGYDYEEKKIDMILNPESTISTLEAFKIMLLINAAQQSPYKFSVYAYIKKNNLERHFKFAQ